MRTSRPGSREWERDYRVRWENDEMWTRRQPAGASVGMLGIAFFIAAVALGAMLFANTCFPVHRVMGQ